MTNWSTSRLHETSNNRLDFVGRVGVGKQDYELVAPVSGHKVAVANAFEPAPGKSLQQVVAHSVPVTVIDVLEVVEIEK